MLQGSKLDVEKFRHIKTCHEYLPEAIKKKKSICIEAAHSFGTTWGQRKKFLNDGLQAYTHTHYRTS